MNRLLVVLAALALSGVPALGAPSSCPNPARFGGDLGAAPRWAVPFCNATAQLSANSAAGAAQSAGLKVVSAETYVVDVDTAGVARVTGDLTALMRRAGFEFVRSGTVGDVTRADYRNTRRNLGYQVLLRRAAPGSPWVMVLLKHRLR